jgi:hypothetical protein
MKNEEQYHPYIFHFMLCARISPFNSPAPLKWARSKSPEQAYDDIKFVYEKYPKRGLRWSSGWIDRGAWNKEEFSGQYFYATAESLAWHYTDDIEFKLDPEKRCAMQYRWNVVTLIVSCPNILFPSTLRIIMT